MQEFSVLYRTLSPLALLAKGNGMGVRVGPNVFRSLPSFIKHRRRLQRRYRSPTSPGVISRSEWHSADEEVDKVEHRRADGSTLGRLGTNSSWPDGKCPPFLGGFLSKTVSFLEADIAPRCAG